jgi:hypothetical protein
MSGSGERRFDVTGLQILASVLATVTGAVAASYLGVAGTIIGAAVMSVASTAGSAFYRHYLGRTAKRMRESAAVAAAHRAAGRATAGTHIMPGHTRVGPPGRKANAPDHAPAGHTPVDHTAADRTAPVHAIAETTIPVHGARHDGPDGGTGDAHGTGAGRGWAGWLGWLRLRPGWVAVTMASLGIFVGVIGGITVFEVAEGKPLDAVVWHHKGTGTTVGGLIGGQSSPAPAHHTSPAHRASPSPSPSSTGTGSPSPSPTPTTGSPSPTNSPSPTPTTSSPSPNPTSSTKAAS